MIRNIFVRSRKNMEQESFSISTPSVIISIRDIMKDRALIAVNDQIKDVLFLSFEDWDRDMDDESVITEADALAIKNFVTKYNTLKEDINLYVNCEAGWSRSAGVAAAISKYLFEDDTVFFKTKTPNMLCYRKVLNALYEGEL